MMNILITGAGSPATWGTCQSLKSHRLIGTDIRDVDYPWLEKCYKVPKPDDCEFINAMLRICIEEDIDVVIPQVEDELFYWSMFKDDFKEWGVRVCVCDWPKLQHLDKFHILEWCLLNDIDCTPDFGIVDKIYEFAEWLDDIAVVKTLGESGGRGTRIIKTPEWEDSFESKPGPWISQHDLADIYRDQEMLVTEYLPGTEYTVDCLCNKGKMLACIPRRRDVIRSGITFEGETVEHKEIIEYCRQIIEGLSLEYIIGFQFKEDKCGKPQLLECNPRVQGTTIHSTLAGANIIEGAAILAKYNYAGNFYPKWGVKMRRYWGCFV